MGRCEQVSRAAQAFTSQTTSLTRPAWIWPSFTFDSPRTAGSCDIVQETLKILKLHCSEFLRRLYLSQLPATQPLHSSNAACGTFSGAELDVLRHVRDVAQAALQVLEHQAWRVGATVVVDRVQVRFEGLIAALALQPAAPISNGAARPNALHEHVMALHAELVSAQTSLYLAAAGARRGPHRCWTHISCRVPESRRV